MPVNKQPLNSNEEKFEKPINGMVLVSGSVLTKPVRRLVTLYTDLMEAGHIIKEIADLTENLIREKRKPTKDECATAHKDWTYCTILYGRCFVAANGRKSLALDDVVKVSGEATIHKILMNARHGQSAHVTLQTRRIEVFADFISRDGSQLEPTIRALAFIESYPLIPEPDVLRQCEQHVARMTKTLFNDLNELQARVTRRLNTDHLSEIRMCLDQKKAWR